MDILNQLGIEIKGRALSNANAQKLMESARGDGPFLGVGGIQLPCEASATHVALIVGPKASQRPEERAVVLNCGHVYLVTCSLQASQELAERMFPMRCRKCMAGVQ